MEPSPQSNSIVIPIAIIFGFALIALAIFYSGIGRSTVIKPPVNTEVIANGDIRKVDKSDYIRGNPNAPILVVEYSDYDCKYCKSFHETMNQIMNEYGATGKVAWVYRQFPQTELHPNSARISEAALCAGEVGGNDAFWKFTDQVFRERGAEELTNISRLGEYATVAGADTKTFNSCLESGRHQNRIKESVEDGIKAGIDGTPHSFVIVGNQKGAIEGAEPYPVVKGIINDIIGQLEGVEAAEIKTSSTTTTSTSTN